MTDFTFIWDWNGTLLDDAQVCVDVINLMLKKRALPLLSLPRYRELFTFPVEDYYRAIGFDLEKESFPSLADEYHAAYTQAARACGLCPGARQALEQLRDWGARQVIVSASRQDILESQVESRGIAGYFEALLGIRDLLGAGKAGLARDYLRAQQISLRNVWCLGDTLHDWEVAQEMGCACVLVAQGHQSRQRLLAAGAPVLGSLWELPAFWKESVPAQ